ncbi:hypothetical protein AMAG_07496 [Allomyces macrogynus ATCC 38327]|uniref:UNC-45/Cro1/She4 central domain-containing protein n=1 Tax=Allomyces macrogynus (strain ATCC 38327) TaxID=578462 RepID=A0A0L0SII2_ALLM3|nr:hypothetical protein AMAG_07496 [Allomyces macrogynus ATCC 38327]|eukprot:KNE62259.1 hypothetical protein AMAG_07496 [Allomyces macrogynus ATCC 38327]
MLSAPPTSTSNESTAGAPANGAAAEQQLADLVNGTSLADDADDDAFLTNEALATRIKDITAGILPPPADVERDLGRLLRRQLAPSPPTLLPLYLAKLLELVEHPPNGKSSAAHDALKTRVEAAATAFLTSQFAAPARREVGARALSVLFQAAPALATRVFVAHAKTFLAPIAAVLDDANPPEPYLDVLANAAAAQGCRAIIEAYPGLVASLTDLARSCRQPGGGRVAAAALAMNVLTKLGRGSADAEQLMSVITADKSTMDQRERAIEGLALASLKPAVKRKVSKASLLVLFALLRVPVPAVGEDLKKDTSVGAQLVRSASFVFGLVTLLHHLTVYPLPRSDESEQLRKLAKFATAAKDPSAAARVDSSDENEEEEEEDEEAITHRCATLLDMNVVSLLAALYQHQCAVVGSSAGASDALKAGVAQICLALSRTPAHRGLMVRQGAVKLLLKIRDRNAVHALARCAISLNPKVAFADAIVPTLAALFFTLLPDTTKTASAHPLAAASGSDGDDLHPLAHFEALLALTNLSTHATVIPAHATWLARLDRAASLTADNLDIRRAAWELLANMLCCPGGTLEALVPADRPLPARVSMLVAMAIAHTHADEQPAMRRAATGVLAMLSFAPAVCAALVSPQEDGTVLAARVLAVVATEEAMEILHRLAQLLYNAAHDRAFATWATKAGMVRVLNDRVRPRCAGNQPVADLVAKTLKVLAVQQKRGSATAAGSEVV